MSAATPLPGSSPSGAGSLARFLQPRELPAPGERCEMCAEPLGEDHPHVADLERRGVMCTCRGCYLLFAPDGAGGGRRRAIPQRYRYDPGFRISQAQWDEMQIPVAMAFVFYNSSLEQYVAFYPSPGGATESLLEMDTWRQVMAGNPEFADLADDVEALLLRRTDDGVACYLVPIDACYDLVGRVRMNWKGFDGGEEAWAEIEAFFAVARERAGVS